MTERIYDFDPDEFEQPIDDPETQAYLAASAADPEVQRLNRWIEARQTPLYDYWCVATKTDGRLLVVPVMAANDEHAITEFDAMVMSWHHSRRLVPYLSLRERTYVPNAVKLELISPDQTRLLSEFVLHRDDTDPTR
ncbi:MAG: hypothetical protein ACKOXM_02985 [Agromyces sp.]